MVKKSIEQYFRSIDVNKILIENIDNGIIILNTQLEIIYYNKWLELHTHLKEKDILGLKLTSIFPNIKTKTLQRKIKTALRMQTPTFYTASIAKYLIPIKINQIKISDFEHMRQDVSIIPFDQEKNLVALIITDQTNIISTHNLLQANIQKVEELNRELLRERETIDEKIILLKVDTSCMITNISKAYTELLGFTPDDAIGQYLFDFDQFTIDKELNVKVLRHIEKKQVLKYEKTSLKKTGEDVWLLNTLVPQYNQMAEHIGFIIFSENITDAKLVQEHQEKLLENSRTVAMGEMVSMIAHQWKQPLSVVNTIIATLKIKKELNILDNTIVNESYEKIESTIKYLSETIDDFRNFFKINKELKTLTVKRIFEKSNHLLENEMKINNIKYTQDIDENLMITTFENELIQTIINILKNSIDAFKEKLQENQKLSVLVTEEKTHISMEIEDNAGGIPKEIIRKIFEPYFSTKSKNGTGLGLYICKTIIQEHLKGEITVQSSGNTTKTIIVLPKHFSVEL
ncbi:MAG: ATP-binding protein [Sulfurimonas sp.]|nr:ATP-binding protein [Sulfurimonas sp.]